MGRILLVGRLAVRDLRRRRLETALLLLAIMAATTTLTLGLVLSEAAGDPYRSTREATNGPDVVAGVGRSAGLARLEELAGADGVVERGGPYPVLRARLQTSGGAWDVQAVGRRGADAPLDRPQLVRGGWVREGGVVVEAAFAAALDVGVGDRLTLDGEWFEVAGVAITAAMPPYPEAFCLLACRADGEPADTGAVAGSAREAVRNPGLLWLTEADVRGLTSDPDALGYVMNLKLADPDRAQAFVDANLRMGAQGAKGVPYLLSWQYILQESTELAQDAQVILVFGSWLLALLAVASIAVLVGGRMAEQSRRVGLLKAVGGTPGLVAAVLLAEYVVVAIVAGAAGLAAGALTAPLLTGPGTGLIGGAGTAPITVSTAGVVLAVAVAVAVAATCPPVVRAARPGTLGALAASVRPPRRVGWLIAVSARLPVPVLLAVRVAARRPRRLALTVAGIAITVSGIVVALSAGAGLAAQRLAGLYDAAQAALLGQVLFIVTLILLCLAGVNAVFLTWATVLDNRHLSALARALGATPAAMSAALAGAQVLPALAGAVLGIFPGGAVLLAVINAMNDNGNDAALPPLWQLLVVVAGTVLVVAVLTALPARLGGRRPVSRALQAEV
ncbi:FtsX-like permease family protein [Planobispora takensis]|uniref:ABC3 transporter permease C-terminal domain-containing protein n=1 Tax=Planobispora takensis TaxID=1367882 RepID=A0A8J3T396_9ACTN|nr:FtsX-like permease family protein [Planobispora takensis]GII05519.1 hypothetical protein Pta02_75270 [Planobispora takensis]